MTIDSRPDDIEDRDGDEIRKIDGILKDFDSQRRCALSRVDINQFIYVRNEIPVSNYAFDVTPARLITGTHNRQGNMPGR
ncbi:MAG: hypothetical protein MZV63_31130 [Marinilabiliales bacterium]|nr:hypothetical protein [Marinilabiliales bacterium]